MLCPVVLTGMSFASVFVQVCVLLMSQGWRMLALSSGVEYFRVSCHVVKIKFGEICCLPAVRGLFVTTYAIGNKVSVNFRMKFSWEIRYVKLYLLSSGPHLDRTYPQEHTFIINTPCGCVIWWWRQSAKCWIQIHIVECLRILHCIWL
jgi:hypothetical protein